MAAVEIPFVKMLQTKFQETFYTILKYENEIIYVPSFVFIGCFYAPAVFVKKREILKILSRENAIICKFRTFLHLNFGRKINRWNLKLFFLE